MLLCSLYLRGLLSFKRCNVQNISQDISYIKNVGTFHFPRFLLGVPVGGYRLGFIRLYTDVVDSILGVRQTAIA